MLYLRAWFERQRGLAEALPLHRDETEHCHDRQRGTNLSYRDAVPPACKELHRRPASSPKYFRTPTIASHEGRCVPPSGAFPGARSTGEPGPNVLFATRRVGTLRLHLDPE